MTNTAKPDIEKIADYLGNEGLMAYAFPAWAAHQMHCRVERLRAHGGLNSQELQKALNQAVDVSSVSRLVIRVEYYKELLDESAKKLFSNGKRMSVSEPFVDEEYAKQLGGWKRLEVTEVHPFASPETQANHILRAAKEWQLLPEHYLMFLEGTTENLPPGRDHLEAILDVEYYKESLKSKEIDDHAKPNAAYFLGRAMVHLAQFRGQSQAEIARLSDEIPLEVPAQLRYRFLGGAESAAKKESYARSFLGARAAREEAYFYATQPVLSHSARSRKGALGWHHLGAGYIRSAQEAGLRDDEIIATVRGVKAAMRRNFLDEQLVESWQTGADEAFLHPDGEISRACLVLRRDLCQELLAKPGRLVTPVRAGVVYERADAERGVERCTRALERYARWPARERLGRYLMGRWLVRNVDRMEGLGEYFKDLARVRPIGISL